MLAEVAAAKGWNSRAAESAIGWLRFSGRMFPLDRRFRIASALYMGNTTLPLKDYAYRMRTIAELRYALRRDPTQGDLLVLLVLTEASVELFADAQRHLDQLRFVAGSSPWVQSLPKMFPQLH